MAGASAAWTLPPDFARDRLELADTPLGFEASLLHDLERGNRIELDWLAGKPPPGPPYKVGHAAHFECDEFFCHR